MAGYSKTVQTLLATSLALPGMKELLAGELPEDAIDYRYTLYDEEPLPENRLAFGDPRRYEIQSHQLRIIRNLDDSYALELDFLHEAMSGSSPWYSVPGPDGPLQVMSGATIRERRNQAQLSLSRRRGNILHRGTVGYSKENDYKAAFLVYSGEYEREDRMRTYSWSGSYSDDRVMPTDADLFGRVNREKRDSISVSAALTQVINRDAVFQAGISATRQTGFLSDPYKQVWINRSVVNDSRPEDRGWFTATARFRQFMEISRAALVLDYRYFRDDWDISSHTLDAAWRQPLASNWELSPSVRYYTQRTPDFYAPYFADKPLDGYWSSDYRLSTFGALSYRLHATRSEERWSLTAGAEFYESRESLALSGRTYGTPGLVDFWRVTLAFRIKL